MSADWVTITDARDGVPTAAACGRCRATWQRPADDHQADTLVVWARHHDCRDALPAWLGAIEGDEAADLASRLHSLALDLLRLAQAASTAQSELICAPDEASFWRATGRHDGLSEAHRHVLSLVEGLNRRGGLR